MTDTCEKHCEANAFKIVIRGLEGEVARLKERLAQEKALQALHNENERLGLYKDAYVEQEPLIGCVNHDCAKCKERTEQEPDYWLGYGLQAHTEKPFENATALYKDPPQRTEQNFCSRCGKRTKDIHTCTPPKD
jgi:hypothetical protein